MSTPPAAMYTVQYRFFFVLPALFSLALPYSELSNSTQSCLKCRAVGQKAEKADANVAKLMWLCRPACTCPINASSDANVAAIELLPLLDLDAHCEQEPPDSNKIK